MSSQDDNVDDDDEDEEEQYKVSCCFKCMDSKLTYNIIFYPTLIMTLRSSYIF